MKRDAKPFGGISYTDFLTDHDQLHQIVSRNKTFLKDFILVICCLIVFVIILVFIIMLFSISKQLENKDVERIKRNKLFLANLDNRYTL
ncbi:ac108 [Erannis ankeraria nucleopolyhedrovirus]|uniref:ac108 n=1 Tax=Erannis ankeraria nucleopolyhedrovirus TaxID=2913600 RepID=UPI00117ADB6B|nr:ac108 [Erannis ankeraria nucleopolyhedrovirus]UJZ89001.1 ac108 [Erannis ankeraria nucleopolyhedrovirus]